jgi:hypothetical protein
MDMDETRLGQLLRGVLLASMAAPFVLGSVACGGRVDGTLPGSRDSGPTDSGLHPQPNDGAPVPPPGCAEHGCACSDGCTPIAMCVNSVLVCSCECSPEDAGMPPDADFPDVIYPDAELPDVSYPDASFPDSGDPCVPAKNVCGSFVPAYCFDAALPDSGSLTPAECMEFCGTQQYCYAGADPSGNGGFGVVCNLCVTGRRPAGLRRAGATRAKKAESPLAGYLAESARLEAASIAAFDRLGAELAAHGAPPELIEASARAAADEVRHARVTAALARRYGGRASLRRSSTSLHRRARSLEAIAIENAVEGCVRETFGALTALAQSKTAGDVRLRAAMKRIAEDETRHAALGWAVARWAEGQLDARARARVEAARQAAIEELARHAVDEPPIALQRVAGLPSAAASRRMLDELQRTLWA